MPALSGAEGSGAATADLPPAASVRAARSAVLAVFFVSGAAFASWVAHIPLVRERLGLSEAALGLALLAGSAGALVALAVAGALVARLGSRRPGTRVRVAVSPPSPSAPACRR